MDNKLNFTKHGYLNEDFHLFHIKDKKELSLNFHFHDFNKIIIFLSGKVTYFIEGKSYILKPWDILLVSKYDIHKPIIDPSQYYERIIIWADSSFIEKHNYENCNLSNCFMLSKERKINLIRLEQPFQTHLKTIIATLEDSLNSKEFGSKLLSNSLFIQLLIYLNRIYLEDNYSSISDSLKYDKQIETILKYINNNLSKNLSIDSLCEEFFISKYYLMHKFKKETGYTLHNYILQKRLLMVINYIKTGYSIAKACELCGFKDYSAFLRAFKKNFNTLPSELKK